MMQSDHPIRSGNKIAHSRRAMANPNMDDKENVLIANFQANYQPFTKKKKNAAIGR